MSSARRPLCVAVTGLNATDNPGPGVGVIRALRAARPNDHYVGLAYDALDRLTTANGLWGAGRFTYDVLDNIRTSVIGARSLTAPVLSMTSPNALRPPS